MNDKRELIAKIQELRQQLYSLILEKHDLQDSEIIEASKELDESLAEYEKMINKRYQG